MSETPKCPYCGAEMKLHQCKSSIRIWYECECGSESPHISPNWAKDTEESWQEAALSAALHRAEPEMRPLTLEEIEKYFDKELDAEPLWIEFHYDALSSRWLPSVPNPNVFGEFTIEYFVRKYGHRYGEYFRCWPRKPTTEQMAAEKWEE